MQNAILGMRTINVSQGYFSDFTHKNLYQIDLAGMDTGIDTWRSKMYLKCLNILRYEQTGFANTVFFGTCDKDGNKAKVHTPGLGDVVLTLAMSHDNVISSRIKVGEIYSADDMIYEEGIKVNATGNHIHLEITTGWVTEKMKYEGSKYFGGLQWGMPNLVAPEKALFLLEGYHEQPIDTGGYNWQWCNSIEYEEEEMIIKDDSEAVYGVDLSTYDKGTINWENLAKIAKFAILRCGYGADRDGQHDDTFFDFCKKCDEHGIKKGAYIYSYAETEQEAINEANHIIRLCNEAGGDFPIGLFLDMEDQLQTKLSKEVNTSNAMAYIRKIWETPYKAGFYSSHNFCNNHIAINKIVGNAIIWVANFGPNDGYYHDIATEFDYDIRQYTSINANKNFSSRNNLDQNLHFAFKKYVDVPQDPGSGESSKEEIEKLRAENEALVKMNEELHDRIDTALAVLNGSLVIEKEGEE